MALKQNNLAEATTEQGFPTETSIPLQREVEVDGTTVTVEGVTPAKIATDLGITYKTPGEPYINGDVQLNGVVQTYNEGSKTKFDTIVLGKSYKFKLKERLDTIDNMSSEELTEFFSDSDNRITFRNNINNCDSILFASFINAGFGNMVYITCQINGAEITLMYITPEMSQMQPGTEPGWYSVIKGEQQKASTDLLNNLLNNFTIVNISSIQNNVTGNAESTSGDDLTEYDSSKLDWLLDSAEITQPNELVSIEITTPPVKTEYNIGDTVDYTGMVVTATYEDSSTSIAYSAYPSFGGTITEATNPDVTVSYKKDGIEKTTILHLTIHE